MFFFRQVEISNEEESVESEGEHATVNEQRFENFIKVCTSIMIAYFFFISRDIIYIFEVVFHSFHSFCRSDSE